MKARALLEELQITPTHAISNPVLTHCDGVVPITALLSTHVELGVTA